MTPNLDFMHVTPLLDDEYLVNGRLRETYSCQNTYTYISNDLE